MTNRPQSNRTTPQNEPDDYLSQSPPRRRGASQRQSIGETVIKSFIRSIASSLGRIIVRTITGRLR